MTLHALYHIADLVAHVRQPADIHEPAVDAVIAARRPGGAGHGAEGLGVDVQAAKSGRAGIELVLWGQPDHVLVDIGLPDLDGYQVCRALRLRVGQGIKLVALTGYGQQVDRERSADAGFDAHVVKPVGPRELLRLLEGA